MSALSIGASSLWFALCAADLRIDDNTYCDSVLRGQFRLHPAVLFGRSAGCITLPFMHDFHVVRHFIRQQEMFDVPCTNLKAYGQVIVL
ncbi:tlde1 domain-containing protein [Luteibacter sp.]|uniref:tlde1 domain-containing protein n=1 Tax=Luteibacter sp. TaxID=1886636 RepID=UPI0039C9F17F